MNVSLVLAIDFDFAFCDGCIYDKRCVSIGAQTVSSDGTSLYCDIDNQVYETKGGGEYCENNYECKSFFCSETCQEIQAAPGIDLKKIILPLALALFFVVAVVAMVAVNKKAKKKKSKQTIVKQPKVTVKTSTVKTSYKEDALEKKLKKSFEEIDKTIKK